MSAIKYAENEQCLNILLSHSFVLVLQGDIPIVHLTLGFYIYVTEILHAALSRIRHLFTL